MGRRKRDEYEEAAGGKTNNWAFELTGDPDLPEVEITVEDASPDEEKIFKAQVREYVSDPETAACRQDTSRGPRVGTVSWYGGPLAMRSWGMYKCKACDGIHGRLEIMA